MTTVSEQRYFTWRHAIHRRVWLVDQHWYVLLGLLCADRIVATVAHLIDNGPHDARWTLVDSGLGRTIDLSGLGAGVSEPLPDDDGAWARKRSRRTISRRM